MGQAQEQLDNESIDQDQYTNVVKQVFHLHETNKIREAERRESLKRRSNNWQQNDLTPISDDEGNFSDQISKLERNKNSLRRVVDRKRIRKLSKSDENNTPQIGSSFATATAADLRNTSIKKLDRNDPRWIKGNESTVWSSPWNPTGQPGGGNSWNNRPNMNNSRSNQIFNRVPATGMNNWGVPQRMPFDQQQSFNRLPFTNNCFPAGNVQMNSSVPVQIEDTIRTINIDGVPREIRFYDDVAVAFMNWDDPKEIGFQAGQRRIVVDDKDSIVLEFNKPNIPFVIDGKTYQIRLGSPTRELYIDNKWYECFFGDPPVTVQLDGKLRIFKIDGPPPQVKIGGLRTDLVVAKINLILDARIMTPVFLDSKQQTFDVDGKMHTIQFADYLMSVLINNEPSTVEFGGLPKSFYVRDKKHFIRFTALPNSVEAGKCYIKNMIRTELQRDMVSPPIPEPVVFTPPPLIGPIAPISMSLNSLNPVNIPGFEVQNIPEQTGYKIEESSKAAPTSTIALPGLNLDINVDELMQKLLTAGILRGNETKKDAVVKKSKEVNVVKPIYLDKPESLKT